MLYSSSESINNTRGYKMTKSNKINSSIFWVRDRKTKITVFKKDDEMKVRKGSSVDSVDLKITEDKLTNNMRARMEASRAASICSVCNSSISIHQGEIACKGEK
tara:strand:- start:224 stop:535 length:312 start_codon:yes stop_codon:yes gene_type:complete